MFHAHIVKGEFRPLQDWVVLAPVKEKERKRGGILLPESVQDYGRCEVMAAGPGAVNALGHRVACHLKPGEFVYVQKFVEGELKFEMRGRQCYAIRERHLNVKIDKQGNLSPIGDRLLVERIVEKEEKRGGIFIPASATEKPQHVRVLGIGRGNVTSKGIITPFETKPGEVVLIGKYVGAELEKDGKRYTIVREDDVIGREP